MSERQTWLNLLRNRGANPRKQALRRHPAIEQLENRLTPAAPVVLSINPATPATPITSASEVTYSVTFGDSVTGVDAADFKVVTTENVQTAAPVVVTGSGTTYSVKVNGILGSGALRLDLIDNDSILGAGPLGGAGLNNGSFQGGTYHIVQAYPAVVSINRATPPGPNTNAASVSFTVTFSTAVTGVDAADFTPLAVTGTIAATQTLVTPVSGAVYTVTVSGITGAGTLGLNLTDNGSIRDADGHPLGIWSAAASFQGQQTYAAATAPITVMSADINGDGKMDLVVLNRNSSSVSVLLGNGDGTFLGQQTFAAGVLPRAAAMGDLNGDGKPDLALANNNASVSVFLSNGNGTFQAQQTFAASTMPRAIAIGDANGDGRSDLAVANYNVSTVSVLLGNGDGSFQAQKTHATGVNPSAVAFSDLNGDGKVDLTIANQTAGSLSLLLGNGDGTFQPQQTLATGINPTSLALGDVNGDGKPDLAVSNYAVNSVGVFLANGNGTFQPQQTFATGALPRTAILAEVNGDGKLDLVTANVGNAFVSVLQGKGDGTFEAQQTFGTGNAPRSVVLTDLNADGKPDLAVANSDNSGGGNNASVLLGIRAGGGFVGQAYTIDRLAPTASIGPVAPDPSFTAVGPVAINFTEAVQNLDIADFSLARNGAAVPLTASMLSGGGAQYSLNLTSVTSAGGHPVLGNYVLTLNPSDVTDQAGNALGSAASDSWQIVVSTTTVLTATPNATTGGELVTFTATVSPSTGNAGTVTFKDNGTPIPAATNVPVVGGVASFQTSVLTAATHPISADFNGAPGYLPSTSNTVNVVVTASQPQLLSVTPNGNIASLAGAQRSRIASLVVAFNQPVQLDAGAMTLALHTNTVVFGGVEQPAGVGGLPNSLDISSTDNVTWIVAFVGNTEGGPDGLNSLKDGVYNFKIDASKVHPSGVPGLNLVANSTTTFHRLYGDTSPATTPPGGTAGVDFQAIDNTGDNLQFRSAFNNAATYKAFFDINGDGIINSGDNLQFRNRFNKALSWKV
jgi:hypothetical protein